ALLALQALLAHGVEVRPLEEASFRRGEVMVGALFGTGLKGPLTDFYAELVERVNRTGLPVLGLGLPSGVPFRRHVGA
ncbi:NAD(P)H-hydrate epimerase, partial [Methylobacterium crusticola]|uniref:NAD(P)H-hydrate epimerase n=1 Tax=Methylobacterium crusticola TaxID=1697972 RepID=UPI0023DF39EB